MVRVSLSFHTEATLHRREKSDGPLEHTFPLRPLFFPRSLPSKDTLHLFVRKRQRANACKDAPQKINFTTMIRVIDFVLKVVKWTLLATLAVIVWLFNFLLRIARDA
jgi:hypothetical protein